MVVQLIIFDLDGTLVTGEIDFHAMRIAIRDLLLENGFPLDVLPMNSTQDLLRSAFAYAGEQGKSPIEISELRDKVYSVAMKIEWEGAKKAQLVPGAKETLKELQERNIRIAILTNDNREVAEYLLKKHGLVNYIDLVISRDEAPHMKPSTEGLEVVLEHFKIPPERTIFIGDSAIDAITAKKRKIQFIGRLSKLGTEEQLRAEGVIAVFPTLKPIISYLDHEGLLPPSSTNESKG
ncbi:MAG: HAD family hydrolase [Candidatus Thorarchaeota archaeon]